MESSDSKGLRVGDMVRTDVGVRGKVAILNADGATAYVQVDGKLGVTFTLSRLDALTKVEAEPHSSRNSQ